MTIRNREGPVDVLLVEDNPGDVRLTREAFETADVDVELQIAADGAEALEFVHDWCADDAATFPDLVLLDLNLPRASGADVLEELRDNPECPPLPVLVLTSSTAPEDIVGSYERAANAYLVKPDTPDEFVRMARAIDEFWNRHVVLPPASS